MPYDIFKDLTTVSIVVVVAGGSGGGAAARRQNLRRAQCLRQGQSGKLNFASAGVGTTPHLAGEMWMRATGIEAVHVPYKGIGASFTDMMSNKVQMAYSSIAGALPFTSDNRIVALATSGGEAIAGLSRSADGGRSRSARLRGRSLARPVRPLRHAVAGARKAQRRDRQGAAGRRTEDRVREIRADAARHQPGRKARRS